MTIWYAARAAGVVSLLLFTTTICLGALGASSRRPGQRFWLQYVHRSAAITALVLLAVHVIAVIADTYVAISPSVLIWPFAASYRPVALLLGVLALYSLVLAAVVGAARGRLARSHGFVLRWRAIHVAASAGWVLSILHGLLAGTDGGTWWLVVLCLACVAAITLSARLRLRRLTARPTFRTLRPAREHR